MAAAVREGTPRAVVVKHRAIDTHGRAFAGRNATEGEQALAGGGGECGPCRTVPLVDVAVGANGRAIIGGGANHSKPRHTASVFAQAPRRAIPEEQFAQMTARYAQGGGGTIQPRKAIGGGGGGATPTSAIPMADVAVVGHGHAKVGRGATNLVCSIAEGENAHEGRPTGSVP